jgi:hypothetical protein
LEKDSLPEELSCIKSIKSKRKRFDEIICKHLTSKLKSSDFKDKLMKLFDGDEGVFKDLHRKCKKRKLSVRSDFPRDRMHRSSLKRSNPDYRKWSRDQGSEARASQVEDYLFVYSNDTPSSDHIWLYFSTKLDDCSNKYYNLDPIYDANILPKSSYSREDSKVLKKTCMCGSTSHSRKSHLSCPYNKKNL